MNSCTSFVGIFDSCVYHRSKYPVICLSCHCNVIPWKWAITDHHVRVYVGIKVHAPLNVLESTKALAGITSSTACVTDLFKNIV